VRLGDLGGVPIRSRGRVALLGDAAHWLTLISRQGAGMALTSAAIRADALSRVGTARPRHPDHRACERRRSFMVGLFATAWSNFSTAWDQGSQRHSLRLCCRAFSSLNVSS
jgi:2-polyprenyl-6-methoxyphenol hydroxylase-like FAD-dependent oxidoreductase